MISPKLIPQFIMFDPTLSKVDRNLTCSRLMQKWRNASVLYNLRAQFKTNMINILSSFLYKDMVNY